MITQQHHILVAQICNDAFALVDTVEILKILVVEIGAENRAEERIAGDATHPLEPRRVGHERHHVALAVVADEHRETALVGRLDDTHEQP